MIARVPLVTLLPSDVALISVCCQMPSSSFKTIESTYEPLMRLVFKHVDDSMLREIAEADYGLDADAHLRALNALKTGNLPVPMPWEPREVLELVRWSEPEDPTWRPGSAGVRGHWMRLFSCAILLRAANEPENSGYFLGEDSTIIQLVDSAMKLGQESSHAALLFLLWCNQYREPNDGDTSYFAEAILCLAVSLGQCDAEMGHSWIAAAKCDDVNPTEMYRDCQKAQTWKDVVRRTLVEANGGNKEIEEFGRTLIGESNAT